MCTMPGLRRPVLISPLGANFDPMGELCHLRVKFSPRDEVFPQG
jgi:hypothetical protein